MYAQCPECLTVYALDAATMAQAHGNVGCGHCGATFNALATLVETLPEDAFDILPVHPTSPAPPILMLAGVHEAPPQQPLFEDAPVDADSAVADADADAEPEAETEAEADAETEADAEAGANAEVVAEPPPPPPSFARRRHPTHAPRHRLWWAAACLVLTATLGIQLAWAERVPLTANPATRPWLAQACDWLGCTLPKVTDRAELQLLSRDVRPHPSVPRALLISATLRNNAPYTQPYPVVSITLSDLDGNRIAMRRFRPAEYIADPDVRTAGLAPGATAALMFEVTDPGRNAVAFEFGFQ